MNPAPESPVSLRRLVYALLIALAAGMAAGRILSAMLVYEPVIFRPSNPEEARDDPRRVWPAARPAPEPAFSSNDRSRWAAVRALVDEGTWVIGRRNKDVVLATALGHLGAGDALQLAALAEAGYRLRVRGDEGIVFEDGWQTVDKVMNPATFEYYSTKPPLLTALAAGEYWLLKRALGWSIRGPREQDQRWSVVRTILFTLNWLPLLAYLVLLARLVDRYGTTDWGRFYVLAAGCFATLLTPFLITFNNHTLATCTGLFALCAALSASALPSGSRLNAPRYVFALAGFFAGFTACNELPATAFAAGLFVFLLRHAPRRALLWFVPAALVPVAALLAANYWELGQLRPAYSEFGGPWYEYEGSHWRLVHGQVKRGIDWAWQKESTATYAFHLLLGHHGLFALTPIYFLAVAGMAVGVWRLGRARASRGRQPPEEVSKTAGLIPPARPDLLWSQLAAGTLVLTAVVVGFYVTRGRSNNYGGWTNGPRWLMWLAPLLLLTMLPVVDWLGRRRWGRALALVLLALSVLSASYWSWNPWRHPWIYNWMEARGWIAY